MSENTIFEDFYRKVVGMLCDAVGGNVTTINPQLTKFESVFTEAQSALARINEPLRVAVAGYMKAGKSTLLNAFLGQRILYTGTMITTYTPTWFRYGEAEMIELHYINGKKKQVGIHEMEKWTTIGALEDDHEMEQVAYVIVYQCNDLLKRMELIDTPGLFSPQDKDAERTISFLALQRMSAVDRKSAETQNPDFAIEYAKEVNDSQTANADAIIYAFSGTFREKDLAAVSAFTSTPINALGIFTKADQYWDVFNPEKDPLQLVHAVTSRLSLQLKNSLYEVLPVSALSAEGLCDLPQEMKECLEKLARLPSNDLLNQLASESLFIQPQRVDDVNSEQRGQLMARFGQYGLYQILNALDNGITWNEMPEYMHSVIGLTQVEQRIFNHFGNRTSIIKAMAAVARIENALQRVKFSNKDIMSILEKNVCLSLQGEIDELNQGVFREINLLREYYEGEIHFPLQQENREFLQLLGEDGAHCASRLGLPISASVDELLKAASERINSWSELSYNPVLRHKETNAAQIVLDRLNTMYDHLHALIE